MNTDLEQDFIESFCAARIRERLHFELSLPRRRKEGLNRFSHQFTNILIEKYMFELTKPNSDPQATLSLLKSHGADTEGYCLTLNPKIDGQTLPLSEALQEAVGCGLPSIIICGKGLAYFESEQEVGPPKRFVLKRDRHSPPKEDL